MKIFDRSFLKFLVVGAINTGVSFVIMFALESLGYWISTAIAYFVGAVISFFLNKKYTFKSDENVLKAVFKFALNVFVCYIISYSFAKPVMVWILSFSSVSFVWTERITKVFAMALYTVINYLGQKFVAFNKKI